jgi:hypothetical protein
MSKLEADPAILVAYPYLPPFLENKDRYSYRDWALDSGAYSAWNRGASIDLEEYTETCLRLIQTDPTLAEIFALDVIGDHGASLVNTEFMWSMGVRAIPTFHIGEPESYLLHIAANYPKIALGGVAKLRGKKKLAWAEQCFARVWPKPIHGFGFGGEKEILSLPWHSVDATNWELGPCAFGNWRTFGRLSYRGSNQNLEAEVAHYLRLERKARAIWSRQMEQLGDLDLRLSVASPRSTKGIPRRSKKGKKTDAEKK